MRRYVRAGELIGGIGVVTVYERVERHVKLAAIYRTALVRRCDELRDVELLDRDVYARGALVLNHAVRNDRVARRRRLDDELQIEVTTRQYAARTFGIVRHVGIRVRIVRVEEETASGMRAVDSATVCFPHDASDIDRFRHGTAHARVAQTRALRVEDNGADTGDRRFQNAIARDVLEKRIL